MSQLSFDEQQVISALERLPLVRRVVFAAACAQRLVPAYVRFAKTGGPKTPTLIPTVLERLWDDLSGLTLSDNELAVSIHQCMGAIPREDDPHWDPYAEDAPAAVLYALECRRTGQAQHAAWAARRAYEAVDHFVIEQCGIEPNAPDAESVVSRIHSSKRNSTDSCAILLTFSGTRTKATGLSLLERIKGPGKKRQLFSRVSTVRVDSWSQCR